MYFLKPVMKVDMHELYVFQVNQKNSTSFLLAVCFVASREPRKHTNTHDHDDF